MSLDRIRSSIDKAASAAGRDPGEVTLVAVSKMQPEDRVLPVLEAGHRVFGENRVQEAQTRWGSLAPRFPGVELHVIGPLQTNKARAAVEIAHAIHSLGAEPQKAGVLPDETDRFVARCHELDLPVVGLMCIPPAEEEPGPHFDMLREMAARNGLAGLSMGMSGDFEAAIARGATHVRVGSAIFGARD